MDSIGARILGIVACGALGALAAFAFVGWVMLGGVLGALVATAIATLVATAAFAGWTTLVRALQRPK